MSNSQRGDGDGYHPPVEIYGAGDGGSYSYEEAASSSAQHGTSHLTLPSIRSLDLALSHTQQLPADPSQHGDPSPARSYPTETNLASGYSRPVRQESELEVYGAGHTQRILQGQDVAQHHLDRDGRPIDYRSFTQAGRSESPLPSVVTSYDTYEDGNTQRRVSQEQTQRYDHRTTVQTITQVYQTTYPPSHLSYPYQLPSEALQSAHRVPASASYVTPMYHHIGTTGAQYHAPPSYRQQPTSIRPRQMSSHVQAAATSGTAADALSAAELRTQSTEQYRNLSHDALPNTPRLLASSSSEAAGPSRPYIHRDLQHSRPLSTSTRQPSIDKRPPRPSISKPPRALLSDVAQLGNSIVEIIEHCTALSTFARHYGTPFDDGSFNCNH
ncbi:uncharacterized protein EI90DRAFT_3150840 [Cantharellus anzutake]|uniref:uncharacterized protein n=1 Tax=Cantharellus anzutake TaxID=1750568 RepID=UPI001908F72C|nr:uncharacterized protein EI90DRAFT_3150840 [Cantharellus anzutake]KAF8340483.1 hypothetical protein EI90DRAFT_3150840 [Cantharellus anzutake]